MENVLQRKTVNFFIKGMDLGSSKTVDAELLFGDRIWGDTKLYHSDF